MMAGEAFSMGFFLLRKRIMPCCEASPLARGIKKAALQKYIRSRKCPGKHSGHLYLHIHNSVLLYPHTHNMQFTKSSNFLFVALSLLVALSSVSAIPAPVAGL